MKKVLVFLFVCFASVSMYAQTHWTMDTGNGVAGTNMMMYAQLYFDGTLVADPSQIEIGVFDQDGRCRGAKLPNYIASQDRYLYLITIKGNVGFTYTYRLWDHSSDSELMYTPNPEQEIYYESNKKWGSTGTPFVLDFITATTPAIVPWGDTLDPGSPTSIQDQTVPDNTIVIIENGVIVYANDITLGTNSEIVIEEGGELIHENEIPVSLQLNVTHYDTTTKANNSGYRLIAAPIVEPSGSGIAVPTTMLTGDFDLYKFDQTGGSDGKEWRNWEAENFNLKIDEGYLYANSADVQIEFTGETKGTNNIETVPLVYESSALMKGWNLVGNPFTCKAYMDKPFYVLNTEGSEVVAATDTYVMPLQGFFVKATSDSDVLQIKREAFTKRGNLNITVNKNLAMVDKAIVSFGNGSSLEKFQLNPNHTKVYMTQDGKDYAVVNAASQGEMPVNFKAEENGTYTLDFNSENTMFSYLHLIDNMTGIDVDLLATPSYSFEAQTTDYASRFSLVFATGTTDETFAFINNGEIILNGVTGNTTVQVFDVTGRMIISTNATNHISTENMAAGVYMLRLINGDNVMTQKIVVK